VTIVKNDLYDYGLYIYQDNDNFKFSLDSILLAEFVDVSKKMDTIVDFCSGNCPVPLILSTKKKVDIIGIEIQENIYNLACKSIEENNLNNRIKMINDSIKNVKKYIKDESVDIVTCNPPYFKYNEGVSLTNISMEKAIARHEIEMNLEDIMISARYILKNRGILYLVHRCDRLEEIIVMLNKYHFSMKELQFIYTNDNEASMVLIKAIKNGNIGSLIVNKGINVANMNSYKGIFRG